MNAGLHTGKAIVIFLSLIIAGGESTNFLLHEYNQPNTESVKTDTNEGLFTNTLRKHLDAVSNRDLDVLRTTLSPDGMLLFILPNREMTTTVEDFIQYHEVWFRDTTWTLESEILHTSVEKKLGTAVTEIVYREPDRNGTPYFNRMAVSYAMRKMDGQWYVFKDHASSIERSNE